MGQKEKQQDNKPDLPLTRESLGAAIAARCRTDKEFRSKLLSDPAEVMLQSGMKVPSGSKVEIHKNRRNAWHIALPKTSQDTLSDTQLEQIAAGEFVLTPAAIAFLVGLGVGGVAAFTVVGTAAATGAAAVAGKI